MPACFRNEWRRRRGKRWADALLLAILASFAPSQSATSRISTTALTGERMAPRGQREMKDVAFGDWTKVCFKPGGTSRQCRTSITGTFPTGQMAIRLDIVSRDDAPVRVQVFCPVGLYLPNQVALTIDRNKPHHLPYTWCLTNACIAGSRTTPLLIRQMMTGQLLRLRFVDSTLLSLTATIPLSPFAAVDKMPPAKTFEQDIDE
jgi:invasion protein IalB